MFFRTPLTSAMVLTLALGGVASAQTPAPRPAAAPPINAPAAQPPVQFDPAAIPDPAVVKTVLERNAAAQIAQWKGNAAQGRAPSSNWITATFFVGAARLSRVSTDPALYEYMRATGDRFHYALRGPGDAVGLMNADDQAIGDLYQELYARRQLPGYMLPLKGRLDFNVPYLQFSPAPAKLTWWWCDALFMAPPVLARMSAQTGDAKYIRAMDVQWWRTYEKLYDKQEHLFYRDERFITRKSPNGKTIFWSRGNGWVMGGLARVLESMPEDFATRPRYEALYREMAAKIVSLQKPDGLWRTSLLDTEIVPEPETSGTAFYVYALAFGINHGILDRNTYLPHALKGWAGLNRHVKPDGLLGMVQSAGDQPVPTRPETTAPYANGAFLLAGLEVMNLGKPVSALPVAEPKRDAVVDIPSDMGPNRPATTPQEEANNARRDAERQMMIDAPFDPATGDRNYRSPIAAPFVGAGEATIKLVPQPLDQRQPRAVARFAPDRSDDILWENDRTAHRIYGPALEKIEPPSGSGVDAWAKRVRWPFMDRQLKTGTYHNDQGDGMDYYNVKQTRGVGGLGVWQDNKLWVSRNWKTHKILQTGGDVASFQVEYAPWPVSVDRKVWETRTMTLPLGTNFTRVVSTIYSDSQEPLIVAIGLGKGATVPGRGGLMADRATGRMSFWEPNDPDHGSMGAAIMVDPASVERIAADADNNLILIRVTPGKPFVYYLGAAWDQGLDFHSRAEWEAYVKAQTPNFDPTK